MSEHTLHAPPVHLAYFIHFDDFFSLWAGRGSARGVEVEGPCFSVARSDLLDPLLLLLLLPEEEGSSDGRRDEGLDEDFVWLIGAVTRRRRRGEEGLMPCPHVTPPLHDGRWTPLSLPVGWRRGH